MEATLKTTNNQAPSVESLAAWLLASGETMSGTERNQKPRVKLKPRGPQNPCAEVMDKAIKESKLEPAEIAKRANVSESLVHAAKRVGFDTLTPKNGRICDVVGIDGNAAIRGEYIEVMPNAKTITDPWQSIENEFIGTDQYDAVKAVLGSARISVRALKKAARSVLPKVNRKT